MGHGPETPSLDSLIEAHDGMIQNIRASIVPPESEREKLMGGLSRVEFCQHILEQVGAPDGMSKLDATEQSALVHLISDRFTSPLHATYDNDKTLIDTGQKRTDEGVFDPGAYFDKVEMTSIEMENLDLNILSALFGTADSIQTGKEANFWPMATYMMQRMEQFAEWLGLERYEDGRLKTISGDRPVVLLAGVGNGGLVIDLSAPQKAWGPEEFKAERDNDPSWPPDNWVVYKPITLDAWAWLYDKRDLLRASSKLDRRAALVGIDNLQLPDEFFQNPDNLPQIQKMILKQKKLYLEKTDISDEKLYDMLLNNVMAEHHVPGYEYNPESDFVRLIPRVPPHKLTEVADDVMKIPVTDQVHHPNYAEKVTIDTYKREIAPKLTQQEEYSRSEYQARTRDFLLFTNFGTKANLVFDLKVITGANGDTSVQRMWEDVTEQYGNKITIRNNDDLMRALKLITKNAPFYWFQSIDHEQVFIDVTAMGASRDILTSKGIQSLPEGSTELYRVPIDKGESGRLCKNYVIAVYEAYGFKPDKLYSSSIADNHNLLSNDFAILYRHTGGNHVGLDQNVPITQRGWPIKWIKIFGPMKEVEFTNRILRMQLLARVGNNWRNINSLKKALAHLTDERRLISVDIPLARKNFQLSSSSSSG